MADWVTNLLRRGRNPRALIAGANAKLVDPSIGRKSTEHQQIVTAVRALAARDPDRRQRQLSRYKVSIGTPSSKQPPTASPTSVQYSLRTRVPCRVSTDAQRRLERLVKQYSASTLTLASSSNNNTHIAVKTSRSGTTPIIVLEQRPLADPRLVHITHQGVTIDEDGKGLVIFRFTYPITSCRMSSPATTKQGDLGYRLRTSRKPNV
jgi:hypothetical protein